MKNTGIVRKIDTLGRIVVPKELRKIMDLDYGTKMEIYVDNDKIVLKKYTSDDSCIICQGETDIINYEGKNICRDCLEDILENGFDLLYSE